MNEGKKKSGPEIVRDGEATELGEFTRIRFDGTLIIKSPMTDEGPLNVRTNPIKLEEEKAKKRVEGGGRKISGMTYQRNKAKVKLYHLLN